MSTFVVAKIRWWFGLSLGGAGWCVECGGVAENSDDDCVLFDNEIQNLDDQGTAGDGAEASEASAARGGIDTPIAGNMLDTQHSFYIPGMLHVIHNATRDLKESMSGWKWFLEGLTAIAKVLATPVWRQRLVETCFSSPPACFYKHHFEKVGLGELHIFEGRWGTVATAISELKSRRAIAGRLESKCV